MSHSFFEGSVYHKRYTPEVHEFTYPFYMLDIDLTFFDSLKNRLFSLEGFNLFSFKSKDHFGKSHYFMENVNETLKKLGLTPTKKMHFITLPRVANFVFNPISVLVLFEEDTPTHLISEVHNYNGGRILYPVSLSTKNHSSYEGEARKDMYVSPFLETQGDYRFLIRYTDDALTLKVDLWDKGEKILTASFTGKATPFKSKTIAKLFLRHSFITLWVVTRTVWQSFKLWRKGLTFYEPQTSDQIRRY